MKNLVFCLFAIFFASKSFASESFSSKRVYVDNGIVASAMSLFDPVLNKMGIDVMETVATIDNEKMSIYSIDEVAKEYERYDLNFKTNVASEMVYVNVGGKWTTIIRSRKINPDLIKIVESSGGLKIYFKIGDYELDMKRMSSSKFRNLSIQMDDFIRVPGADGGRIETLARE
jgi:hypothetical protein